MPPPPSDDGTELLSQLQQVPRPNREQAAAAISKFRGGLEAARFLCRGIPDPGNPEYHARTVRRWWDGARDLTTHFGVHLTEPPVQPLGISNGDQAEVALDVLWKWLREQEGHFTPDGGLPVVNLAC